MKVEKLFGGRKGGARWLEKDEVEVEHGIV